MSLGPSLHRSHLRPGKATGNAVTAYVLPTSHQAHGRRGALSQLSCGADARRVHPVGGAVVRLRRCAPQTASEHYLPPWGMKPTVSDRRNLLDLHTLALIHR